MLKRLLATALAAAVVLAPPASAQDEALKARIAQYENLVRQTGDVGVLWLLADAYAQAGDKAKAVEALNRLADMRLGFAPDSLAGVGKLAGDPAYDAVAARMAAEQPRVRRARVAHVLAVPGMVPEGLAYDEGTGRLFIGDGHGRRVHAIGRDGKTRVFAELPEAPLGMTVDAKRSRLWVAVTNAFWRVGERRSSLTAVDLKTGRVIAAYSHPELQSPNDMTVAPNGDVYVSDSLGGRVWRWRAGAEALEPLTPAGQLGYPNGVAVTDDGRHLFVAQGVSLRRIDLATGEVARIGAPTELTTLGVDGLYWRDGALIGVQNGPTLGRVLRLELSPARDAVTGWKMLEAGNPAFDVPTTGAIARDRMFVIANAQLSRLKEDGTLDRPELLKPITILELPL